MSNFKLLCVNASSARTCSTTPETRQLAGVCSPLPQILRTGFDHIAELLEHVDEGILFE